MCGRELLRIVHSPLSIINMANLQVTSRGAVLGRKFNSDGLQANALRTDLAAVTDDLTGGCAAGATLTGPARTITTGQRVIAAGWASAPGTLFVETSTDAGSTWAASDSETITAGETLSGSATIPASTNRYRLRLRVRARRCFAGRLLFAGSSLIHITSRNHP
jgi:hypothetical protein